MGSASGSLIANIPEQVTPRAFAAKRSFQASRARCQAGDEAITGIAECRGKKDENTLVGKNRAAGK